VSVINAIVNRGCKMEIQKLLRKMDEGKKFSLDGEKKLNKKVQLIN
jgi:hypothetical protein